MTRTKSTPHNKMVFKDEVALKPHSTFRILKKRIAPNSNSDGSNSDGQQGTCNHTFEIYLVSVSIAKSYNNGITVDKTVNTLMKLIHDIEGYAKKFKIAPQKSKQPNLEVLKYMKGGK